MGVRGAIEGFSTVELSMIASAYFVGFLGGSRLAPKFIARVGHVRVFAALGSLISAVLIAYPVLTDPWAWMVLRVIIGFSLSGVYVTAESWLNNAATNETRGSRCRPTCWCRCSASWARRASSARAILRASCCSSSLDPRLAQLRADPAVGLPRTGLRDFAPDEPAAALQDLALRRGRHDADGLHLRGAVRHGGGLRHRDGPGPGAVVDLRVVLLHRGDRAAIPDRLAVGPDGPAHPDRGGQRLGAVVCLVGIVLGHVFPVLLAVGALSGGLAQPLYALLIAYTNDYLDYEDMAAASGGLLFVNGIGAIIGPLAMGILMEALGPGGFWLFLAAVWRPHRLRALADDAALDVYAGEDDYEGRLLRHDPAGHGLGGCGRDGAGTVCGGRRGKAETTEEAEAAVRG
jgi:hypothetical protein